MQSLLVHDVLVVQWVSKVKETLLEVPSSQLLHYFLSPCSGLRLFQKETSAWSMQSHAS